MRVDRDHVRRLAGLAKLELTDPEIEGLQRDLESILDYVEALKSLDTSDVPPTAHVGDLAAPLRADDEPRALPVEDVAERAPRSADGAFVVPRIVE